MRVRVQEQLEDSWAGKYNVVDAAMGVVGRGGRQDEVTIDTIATVRVDGGCVGVELDLYHLKRLKVGSVFVNSVIIG
jgi:hypothetical protein